MWENISISLHDIAVIVLSIILLRTYMYYMIKDITGYFLIRRKGENTKGKIIDLLNSNKMPLLYTPVVEYFDIHEKRYTKKITGFITFKKPAVNANIPLKYRMKQAGKIIVDTREALIIQFIKIAFTVAFFILLSYFILVSLDILKHDEFENFGLNKVLHLVFSIIFAIFIFHFSKEIIKYFSIKQNGISTKGRIINIASEKDGDGIMFYAPVIEYFDLEGKKFTKKISDLYASRKPAINSTLPLKYKAGQPEKPIVDTTGVLILQFVKIFFALVGLGIVIMVFLSIMNVIEII